MCNVGASIPMIPRRRRKNVAISLSIRNPPQFCSSPPKGTCHPFARRRSKPPFRRTTNGHRLHLPYMDWAGYAIRRRRLLKSTARSSRYGREGCAGYDDSHFSIAPLRLPSLHRASRRTHPYDIPPPPRSACLPPADGHGRLDGLSRVLSQIPSSTPHILSLDSRAEFVISSSNSRRKRCLSKRRMALSHLPPSFLRQGRRRLDVCRCSSSTRWIDSPSDSRPGVLPYFGLVMARRDTSLFRFQAMYLLYTSRCRSLFLTCVMGFG
jgi:hypothetical protein